MRPVNPPVPHRTRGRPVQSSGRPDAREALLDAAVALFAERGVAASTAVDIASRAGVTPAMIHYYFKGRDRLIDAVVEERMARFVMHVFGVPLDRRASAADMIATIAGRIFDAASLMPWMPPIWIREIASEGGLLRERALRHLPVAAVGGFVERLAAAQRRGEIAEGIEPRIVFVSIMGLTMFPLATQSVWRRLPGADRLTAKDLQHHAMTLLATGLSGRSAARTRRRA
jgi:AcrR family transcriptional regulator